MAALIIGMMIVSSMPLFATAQTTTDTLVIALQSDMKDMNPWNPDTNDVWKNFQIGWNFEGLMAYNPDFELYPVLAAEKATGPNGADVFIDASGLNITVKIRQGVTFTDGKPMTSKDVVFSYQTLGWGLFQTQVLGPLYWDDGTTFTKYNGGTSHIGVEANGTYAVDFHLAQPYAMFWYLTMAVPISPWHIWQNHSIALVPADYPSYDVTGETGWVYSYGSAVTEIDACIGTGPMKLQSWVKEQGTIIKPYEGYWGKNMTTSWKGVEYPNYPKYVKEMRFKIYTQLDVAILALQNGEVHHLPWSLTPGYYNQLKTDPKIGIETNKDQGLFYMSFNMRKSGISDVNFRRAIAYCVDKQYIVDRLMGGYGIKGTVPMSVTNTFYVNTTVPAWIQGGNLDAAEALLDANGYTDKDGDGWRDMPDGSPIKFNILTPPKDYDPIRADSGIMIEKNLKSIKLNIAAVPTSFDTIVSAAYVSLDFDMYILGWSVGSFPESYLRDFFHSESDVAINPAGSNAAGYHNATMDAMIDEMETTMDTDDRAQLVKDICGATMMDVAYDTLYYRTNIEAYRKDIWTGWIPAFGSIYNGFSIYNLAPPGTEGGDTGEGGGEDIDPTDPGYSGGTSADRVAFNGTLPINAVMSMPDKVSTDSQFTVTVTAQEKFYDPTTGITDTFVCEGANVFFQTSHDQFANVTTDANGKAAFTPTVNWADWGSIDVYANVSKGEYWYNLDDSIEVIFLPDTAKLTLAAEHAVIAPGGTTNVTAKVVDINGNPRAGVKITVDENLMFGAPDVNNKTTNAAGEAIFVYTAPLTTMLPNTNRYEQFKATISVPNTIIPDSQATSTVIAISNDVKDWYSIDITGVTDYVITGNASGTLPMTTDVTVTVLDQDGAPVDAAELTIEVDNTIATPDALTKNTNVGGQAVFTLTAVDLGNSTESTMVRVFNYTRAYATEDTFLLCNANESSTMTAYAADIDFEDMVDHQGTATITATVWNQTGALAVGVPCQFFIPLTPEGPAGVFDGGDSYEFFEYGDAMDFGWWAGYLGSWLGDNATVTDGAGQLVGTITTPSFIADSVIPVEFGIGGYGITDAFNFTVNQWWMEDYGADNWVAPFTDGEDGNYYLRPADFTISDAGILWRAPVASLASVELDSAILSMDDPVGVITMTFQDIDGELAATEVQILEGTAKPVSLDKRDTNSDGVMKYSYDASANADFDAGIGFTAMVTESDYSQFPFNFYLPYVARGAEAQDLIIDASTSTPTVEYGDMVTIDATVTDEFGNLMKDASVFVGGARVMTDVNGTISTEIAVPSVEGIQSVPIVATKSGYIASFQTVDYLVFDNELFLMVEYWNLSGPTVAPLENVTFDIGYTAKNNGTVDGWTTFEFVVDNVTVESVWIELDAGQTKNLKFTTSLTDLNYHNFTVRQKDRRALAPWTIKAAAPIVVPIGILSLGAYTVPTNITQGVAFTITVVANNIGDAAGTFDIPFVIDGVTYYKMADIAANASVTVSFEWTFADAGAKTICGVSRTVAAAEVVETETGYGIGTVAMAAIAMLIVGLLIGMIIAKMMGGGAGEAAAEPEAEPAPEPEPMEETPPEPPVEEAPAPEETPAPEEVPPEK